MSIRLRKSFGGTGTKPVERLLRKACRGLRRRVVLAPLGWCQVLRETRKTTVTNKVMDTGESAP
jgi:hypothetical protein